MKIKHENPITKEDISALFPPIPKRANKGSMGRVICICGSYSNTSAMCGAAYFAAAAAYRCGAGIVEIFTARENFAPLSSLIPEAVFTLYGKEDSEDDILSNLACQVAKADSIVIGCGLGTSHISEKIVKKTLEIARVPLVIDADALNIIAKIPNAFELISPKQREMTVLTPHMGEMSRLCNTNINVVLADPENIATEYAIKHGVICLLKDHKTVITDGHTTFINESGNPGMASGGMGDVLSGILGALLARRTLAEWISADRRELSQALYRAAAGAYLHGSAGDIASKKTGEYSLTSSDLLAHISQAIIKNS